MQYNLTRKTLVCRRKLSELIELSFLVTLFENLMTNKKRIYIAYTGGTIGMKPSKNGFVPVAAYLSETINNMPEFFHDEMPEFEIHEYEP